MHRMYGYTLLKNNSQEKNSLLPVLYKNYLHKFAALEILGYVVISTSSYSSVERLTSEPKFQYKT